MIDHLVYLVHDLDRSRKRCATILGVPFSAGGRHPRQGTRNVLLRLGDHTYLELLAVDADNEEVSPPRWMGADLLPPGQPGRLSRWAVRGGTAFGRRAGWLAETQPAAGRIMDGSRVTADGTTLRWRMSDPLRAPLVRSLPFLLDWQGGTTPPRMLPDQGCRLRELRVSGPHAAIIRRLTEDGDPVVCVEAPEESLTATITGPGGTLVLG